MTLTPNPWPGLTRSRLLLSTIVFVTLAVGATFRLANLGAWSFWVDEVYTIRSAYAPVAIDAPRATYQLVHHANRFWGISERHARLLPALVGIAMLPLFFGLVSNATNRTTATVAMILLATAPWHVYWSQNARHYILVALCVTISIFAFHGGLEKKLAMAIGSVGYQLRCRDLGTRFCGRYRISNRSVPGFNSWQAS